MSLLLLFRPRSQGTPPPPPPSDTSQLPVSGGGAGWANPKLSSLTHTWNLPGVREVLQKEDELIIDTILMAVVNETLH